MKLCDKKKPEVLKLQGKTLKKATGTTPKATIQQVKSIHGEKAIL